MEPPYSLIGAGLLGLLVGSFLNVVVYRLPIMLHQASPPLFGTTPFNLIIPRSHCPHCQKSVPPWANIPLLGYLILKGRCLLCKHSISLRYPLLELITAIVSILVVQHFGLQWQSISALILSWGLIALTVIDFDHQLLPDAITFPLLWIGLFVSLFKLHVNTQDAIIGAITGYLCLWLIAKLFKIIRKKEGMGEGDFKLLALLGAWLGWQSLPAIILIASLSGLLSNVGLIWRKPYKDYQHHCIPFGPYLSLGGWIMLIWGQAIINF